LKKNNKITQKSIAKYIAFITFFLLIVSFPSTSNAAEGDQGSIDVSAGSYLQTTGNTQITPNGDWTIEGFIKLDVTGNQKYILRGYSGINGNVKEIEIYNGPANYWAMYGGATNFTGLLGTYTETSRWLRFVFQQDSNIACGTVQYTDPNPVSNAFWKFGGVWTCTGNTSTNTVANRKNRITSTNPITKWVIGSNESGQNLDAKFANVRISNIARYSFGSNLAFPTDYNSTDSNTKLLIGTSGDANNYLDLSGTLTVSKVGTVATSVEYPFLGAASYAATFDGNGNTSGSMSTQSARTAGALNLNSFQKTNYRFVSWNTLQNGTGTSYLDGGTFPFTASRTLYAQWELDSISQTVTFNSLANKSATDANFDLSATASSGLSVSYLSDTADICTVTTSGTVDILKAGTCTINADQSGGVSGANTYAAASRVTQSFTVNKVSQAISFDLSAIGSKNTDSSDFSISATGGASGNSVTFSSANAYCTVSGSTVHIVSAGTCVIAADQVGNDIYSAASQVTQSFIVNQLYSVTYALGTLGTGSVPTQIGKTSSDTFTVALGSGLSRSGFTFIGWNNGIRNFAAGDTYTVSTSNVTLTAQWRQNSLVGITDDALSGASDLSFSPGGNINRSIVFDDGTSSVIVRVPFDAFSIATTVKVQALSDTNFARNRVDLTKSFPINLVVSWLAADGTVPTANSALTMTINNPSIKAGSTAYQIIGDVVSVLGRATTDGQLVVSMTDDPVVSVTNDTATVDVDNNNINNNGGNSSPNVVSSAVLNIVSALKTSALKPSLTVYSASPRFSLDTLAKIQLKKYAKKLTNNSSVTCVGYIYPNSKNTKTKKLATIQATNVCKYLKTQNKTLKTIIEIKSAKTAPKAAPGARWITTSYRVDGVLVRAL
jgi:uncharacterized repeat protein (TIGR02543 family)